MLRLVDTDCRLPPIKYDRIDPLNVVVWLGVYAICLGNLAAITAGLVWLFS